MQIPGTAKVVEIFGQWPSFHDAEVVGFALERSEPFEAGPRIVADVHAFEMTDQIAEDGTYVLKNHTLISFHFAGVDQVQLGGFNNQNVLWDLTVTDISDRQLSTLKYEVSFASSFGMGAHFLCRKVTISKVEPWSGRGDVAC